MSMVVLSAASGEWENIFALLIKVLFASLVKTENIRIKKKPPFPWCTTHKDWVFYSPVTALLKWYG